MENRSITDEVVEELGRLEEGERRSVLEYARSLRPTPLKGVSGVSLLDHLGRWAKEDADEIAAAIEEGCEQVNLDAW